MTNLLIEAAVATTQLTLMHLEAYVGAALDHIG
jgi:hypothetical protein